MDEDIIRVLATAAAGVIIRAMGITAWRVARDRWARILGRGDIEREDEMSRQLDESAGILETDDPYRRQQAEHEVEAEWRGSLRTLLREDPELVVAVRAVVAEQETVLESIATGSRSVRQNVAVRRGISIQSGHDTSIG